MCIRFTSKLSGAGLWRRLVSRLTMFRPDGSRPAGAIGPARFAAGRDAESAGSQMAGCPPGCSCGPEADVSSFPQGAGPPCRPPPCPGGSEPGKGTDSDARIAPPPQAAHSGSSVAGTAPALQERIRELDLCNQVLTILLRWSGSEACTRILELLLETTSSRLGCLGRIADGGALVCTVLGAPTGSSGHAIARTVRLSAQAWPSVWRQCTEEARIIRTNSLGASVPGIALPLHRALVIPLRHGASVLGLLCLANRDAPYTERHARLVAAAAEPLGTALRLRRERKKAEARQRELQRKWKLTQFAVDHSPGVILTLDPDGRILYANKTACRTLGYRLDELVSKNIRRFLEAPAAESWETWCEEMKRQSSSRFEARFRTSAGSAVLLDVLAGCLEFDGRRFIPLVCRDISDYVAAREELLRALEKEREATRVKSEFLANVNHELRTPLNAIIGMTELLLHTSLSEEQHEYAEIVHRASHDLLRMIEDILELDKIEAGKLELRHCVFDPRKLLENVAGFFMREARDKGIELSAECGPGVPPLLVGDAGRIRQVLLNLAANAVKFTPSGRVLIRADCTGRNGELRRIRFAVQDSGIGIPKEKHSLIFEKFSQVDGSATRRHEGVGVGLAIVKKLVELMGGELGIESQVGRGSTFWFILWMPVGAGRPVGQEAGHAAPRAGPTRAGVARVLVVEDNPVHRKVTARLLERLGCSAETACDAAEAVELVRSREYHLVLVDCQMPVMNGCEATRRIREALGETPHVPIVAMTARAMKDDVQACLAAGMDDFIGKPVHLDDLRMILEKWAPREAGSSAAPSREQNAQALRRDKADTNAGPKKGG